jgi:hypothetical protein
MRGRQAVVARTSCGGCERWNNEGDEKLMRRMRRGGLEKVRRNHTGCWPLICRI